MASLHSMMVTSDPRMEKENLVPRVQRSEPGTGPLRARGLTSGEQRSSAVLRESPLQNLAPGPVNISKGGLGSVEKDRFKTFSSDPSKGKTTTGSLELLKEKLGQLKNASVLKQPSQKTSSTHEPSGVSDFNKRGPTPTTGNESKVQVYRDVKQSNCSSGGFSKDSSRMESQRRLREANSKSGSCSLSVPMPIKAAKIQETHENHSSISPSTPTKSPTKSMSSTFSRTSKGTPYKKGLPPVEDDDTTSQSCQRNHCTEGPVHSTNQSQHINKVEAGVTLTAEKALHKESSRSLCDGGIGFHGEKLKTGTDKTAPSITPPNMEDANSDNPNLAASGGLAAAIEKLSRTNISKRAKCSRFGPALRVRVRDDPTFPGNKENHSPGSETSSHNDHMNPEVLSTPVSDDFHDKEFAIADSEPHPDPTKEDDNLTMGSAVGTLENCSLVDPRKRKPEADPYTTDTSLMTGCVTHSLGLDVQTEELNKSENILEDERLGSSTSREFRSQFSIRDQTGDGHTGDTSERPTVGQTKGTPGSEREPWAWKTTRDSRLLSHPSPTLPDQSRTGTSNGGIPPRYVPPILGLREHGLLKSETNEPAALEVHKHSVAAMKRETVKDDIGRPELKKEVTPGGTMSARSLSHADEAAVNLLSNTLSTISIGEKNVSGSSSYSKHSLQGKANTQHLTGLSIESVSLTGLTGVTGVTSQSMEQRAPLPSCQVTEISQKSSLPHSVQEKESVCRPEIIDQNGFSKGTTKASSLSSEGPAHESHATKSSSYEAPREKVEKNEEEPPPHPQMQRKIQHESENDKFVYVNGTRYQKLGKIGKGGSSEVFKVIAIDCSIYALKRINLKGRDYVTARGFYQEIEYLEALRGKRHIIQLIDSEVTNKKVLDKRRQGGEITEDAFIYMVLEFGEIDLAGILSDKLKKLQGNGERKLDENWLRYNWQQMLEAVQTIHDERIVHSDLKPANFLMVKGELKLIDFGIAKAIQNDTTNIVRDCQVGTVNYMAPEAFLQNQTDEDGVEIKQGRASDIWSLGCILYQMVYGLTPFAELSFYSKMNAIVNPHHKINYPPVPNPWLVDLMKKCLIWDRKRRLRIPELLQHPFIRPSLTPLIPIRQYLVNGPLSKQHVMQNVKAAITSNLPVEWVAELCKQLHEESESAMVKLANSSRSVRYTQAQTISNT